MSELDGNDLIDLVREMAATSPGEPGEMYQTPEGEFRLTGADCITGSARNRYVISRKQLATLMWDLGIRTDQLDDAAVASRLAAAVIERR